MTESQGIEPRSETSYAEATALMSRIRLPGGKPRQRASPGKRKWDKVFDPTLGAFGQWFPGAMLNNVLQLP